MPSWDAGRIYGGAIGHFYQTMAVAGKVNLWKRVTNRDPIVSSVHLLLVLGMH